MRAEVWLMRDQETVCGRCVDDRTGKPIRSPFLDNVAFEFAFGPSFPAVVATLASAHSVPFETLLASMRDRGHDRIESERKRYLEVCR